MHKGNLFSHISSYVLAVNATIEILFDNPVNNYIHLRVARFTAESAPADILLYENTLVSSNGTLLTIYNKNRAHSNTPNASLSIRPTITNNGTLLDSHMLVGEKQAGGLAPETSVEWILKPSTLYLLKYVNRGLNNTKVLAHISFYEV